MIELAVYNRMGEKVDSLKVDREAFGGYVRYPLLKQAVVMYHASRRVGTATTKTRSMVEGSTRKLFRQKGTGNARVGNIRTGKRVGGGVTFGKYLRDFSQRVPKKQKRLAAYSAMLAKLLTDNVVVIDELAFTKPRTKDFTGVLGNLKIERSCLVMDSAIDANVYKSARNLPRILVVPVAEMNAGDICSHNKVLITKNALLSLVEKKESGDKD